MTTRSPNRPLWYGLALFAALCLTAVSFILNWQPNGAEPAQAPVRRAPSTPAGEAASSNPTQVKPGATVARRRQSGETEPQPTGTPPAGPVPTQGRVVDGEDRPVAGARVVLTGAGPPSHTYSDRDGWFPIDRERAAGGGLQAQALSLHHTPSPTTPVAGPQLVLRLGPGGTAQGQVVDGANQPVASAQVIARLADPTHPAAALIGNLQPAYSQPDGHFELGPLMPGTFDLVARPATGAPGERRDIVIASGASTPEIIIRVGEGAHLTGRVTAAVDARPIVGAQVRVINQSASQANTAQTDVDGRYDVEGLEGGSTRLRIVADGFVAEVTGAFDVPSGGRSNRDVELRRPADARPIALPRVGATLRETTAGLVVEAVTAGSAAAQAGLLVGDRLVSVDFQAAANLAGEEVGTRIESGISALLTVEVERRGEGRRSIYLAAPQ